MSTTIKKITSLLPTLLVVFFAAFVILSYRGYLDYKFFTVMTGSMSPVVPSGSLIIVKPSDSYLINDILTFKSTQNTTVTHRLVAITQTSVPPPFNYQYQLKGDANQVVDSAKINPSQVIGKVIINIAFLGLLISFVKTPLGFISLIILPAIIISVGEIKKIREAL